MSEEPRLVKTKFGSPDAGSKELVLKAAVPMVLGRLTEEWHWDRARNPAD